MLRKILMRAINYIFVLIGPAKAGACFSLLKDLLRKSLPLIKGEYEEEEITGSNGLHSTHSFGRSNG